MRKRDPGEKEKNKAIVKIIAGDMHCSMGNTD